MPRRKTVFSMKTILKILFWTYDRGSWQYDVLCGLILVFIFLTPKVVFSGSVSFAEQEFIKSDTEATAFFDLSE